MTGIDGDNDGLAWTIGNAAPGVRCLHSLFRDMEKGFVLNVNGAKLSGLFQATPGFATYAAGKVELKRGSNRIAIERGWGYYNVDYIELVPTQAAAPLRKPPVKLVDAQASAKTLALLKLLIQHYGQKTLSGQYDVPENNYIREVTGQTPAIFAADLIDYSPTRIEHGAKQSPTTEEIIRTARAGQIITLSWHWNAPTKLIDGEYQDSSGKTIQAPWWRGFNTDATAFDVQKTLASPDSEDYAKMISDIDAIAVQLKKLQTAGMPVLWRPLHEAAADGSGGAPRGRSLSNNSGGLCISASRGTTVCTISSGYTPERPKSWSGIPATGTSIFSASIPTQKITTTPLAAPGNCCVNASMAKSCWL